MTAKKINLGYIAILPSCQCCSDSAMLTVDSYSSETIHEITLRGKNGIHAFGYNPAESERIWMKSGALWAHCWGLVLADFGRDPSSNGSL